MKVKILDVQEESTGNIVSFCSEYGSASAIWMGRCPEKNSEYFVEIEIPEKLKWEKHIVVATEHSYALGSFSEGIYFVGVLEGVGEDGCCCLRVGDSIVLLEIEGGPIVEGVFVQIRTVIVIAYEVSY